MIILDLESAIVKNKIGHETPEIDNGATHPSQSIQTHQKRKDSVTIIETVFSFLTNRPIPPIAQPY